MIDAIELVYQKISDSIAECIDEPCRTAEVEIIYYVDGHDCFGTYARSVDGIDRPLNSTRYLRDSLLELRDLLVEAGKRPFGEAKFTMDSDGDFKLTFNYNHCDSNGFQIFDAARDEKRENERTKHFLAGIEKMTGNTKSQ